MAAPSPGLCGQLACIWEATARKPGNVHRYRDFDDTNYLDFVMSAAAIAPVLERACEKPIGGSILDGVRGTRLVTGTNTNLGMVLLLTPLAAVPAGVVLRDGVAQILAGLTVADARTTYEAIRLAFPGGLGKVDDQDVCDEPSQTLRQVMELAAERDLVARQYADDFREVFEEGVPALHAALQRFQELETAIIFCHLQLMASYPDSLIARKQGAGEAEEAAACARRVLAADWPRGPASAALLAELDAWLRAVGHRRNPGTTADLVTACLFVALREGILKIPLNYPWSAGSHHG